jgi:hypothetical protein
MMYCPIRLLKDFIQREATYACADRVKDQEVKQHLIIEQEVFQLSSQSGPEA